MCLSCIEDIQRELILRLSKDFSEILETIVKNKCYVCFCKLLENNILPVNGLHCCPLLTTHT